VNGGYYTEEGDYVGISIWQRLSRLIWVLLALTIVAVIIGAFLPELSKQRTEQAERARLHREISEQRRLRAQNERKVLWLTNNPEYIESIARDRGEFMKEGETIYRMEEPKAAKPAPPPAPSVASPARKTLN
jgi:cell division protein FtsB